MILFAEAQRNEAIKELSFSIYLEYFAYHGVERALALHPYQRKNFEESGMIPLLNLSSSDSW